MKGSGGGEGNNDVGVLSRTDGDARGFQAVFAGGAFVIDLQGRPTHNHGAITVVLLAVTLLVGQEHCARNRLGSLVDEGSRAGLRGWRSQLTLGIGKYQRDGQGTNHKLFAVVDRLSGGVIEDHFDRVIRAEIFQHPIAPVVFEPGLLAGHLGMIDNDIVTRFTTYQHIAFGNRHLLDDLAAFQHL